MRNYDAVALDDEAFWELHYKDYTIIYEIREEAIRIHEVYNQRRIYIRTISVILREKFDYTKWQRQRFDHVSSDEFQKVAIAYEKENPFSTKRSKNSRM